MDLAPTIKRVQAHLGLKADGIAGPLTWGAISSALGLDEPPPPVVGEGLVDPRSEINIDTLLPVVRPLARSLVSLSNAALEDGKVVKITSGYRTFAEQAELYAENKAGGPQAAPPGYSNHNYALAFDVTLFDSKGKPIWESPDYRTIGAIGRGLGLIWGGDWPKADEPHYEFRPDWAKDFSENQSLAEYRERQKAGISLV